MKLVSYQAPHGARGGVLLGEVVYDLEPISRAFFGRGNTPATSVRELLERYGARLTALSGKISDLASTVHGARVGSLDDVNLLAPMPVPHRVFCIGLNYKDHVAETGRALPEHPDVFAKFASTMIGPRDEIGGTDVSSNLDFEGELAVVIGRPARFVDRSSALDFVAGYAPLNDITARDLQYRGTQWLAGKAVDSSTPWGPAIVTADEIGDPQALDIVTRVNGTEMQRSNTRHQIFAVADVIAYISQFLQLEPGDVIATGTPQGIGAKRTPPIWLTPGDEVEIEIDRVGTLRNRLALPA